MTACRRSRDTGLSSRTALRRLSEAATPGPWGVGHWSGQCNKHELGGHPGPTECVYDYRLDLDPDWDDEHRIIALEVPAATIAGNYDYEEGGIVQKADRDFIVAAVNYVRDLLEPAS